MRLTTWNVNGIRNPFSYQPWNSARSFPAMFDILESDIIVMQELKIQRKDLRDDMVLLDGWDCFFSLPKHKKGYSGVGIYTRNATCAPIRAEEGLLGVLPSPSGVAYCDLPEDQSIGGYPNALQVAEMGVDPAMLDAEGRCVVLEFPAFVLFGIYSPANSNGLRDDFRYGFICALDCRIRNLSRQGKRVVLVGDLNVSRDELDTASAADDMKKAGITHEDYISTPNRRIFNQLLVGGEVVGARDEGREQGVLWDTTRAFHPDRKGMYTHWEQKINARPGNFGSRIDFVLVCKDMQSWIQDANIQEGLLGSDHCPVFVDFKDVVSLGEEEESLLDIMNPIGYCLHGIRKQDWRMQDAPAFSGKKLQEFDKRRSIKSMFTAPTLKKAPSSAAQVTPEVAIVSVQADVARQENDGEKRDSGKAPQENGRSSPGLKRKVSTSSSISATKRKKPEPALLPSKGQQSLKGFFQRRDARPVPEVVSSATSNQDLQETASDSVRTADIPVRESSNGKTPEPPQTPPKQYHTNHSITSPPGSVGPSPAPTASTISPYKMSQTPETREQNHHSWNALFSRPVAPLCEGHNEPCKSMQTKKKGSNQGRSFWMCTRPLGPSGNKERGTQWRCPTFIWCSDWNAKREASQDGGIDDE